MKAGYRDRITEDPDEKESEDFHLSHPREEEWKQVRALHLVRDERDREVGAAAKGRAGDAVLAASQLFAAVCLLRGDPAWAAFLSLTFVGGGAQCLHRFWEDRERFFLICGLAASACGAALGCWYLLQDPGTGPSLGRLAAFALLISLLTSLSGLIFVPLLLGAVWLKYKVGRMDGEAWEHYFQSVSTVGLLLRGGVLLLLALGLTALLSWPLFALLGFPMPERLALLFFLIGGADLFRKLSQERDELVRKLLRLKLPGGRKGVTEQ